MDYSQLHIDQGIPVPPRKDRHPVRLLIAQMQVGDSIFFPAEILSQTIYSHYKCEKKDGKKFLIRKIADGSRLWRTE